MVTRMFVVAVSFLGLVVSVSRATDGLDGVTVRPRQQEARVQGCKIAAPGVYEVEVGNLIELDYQYPVVPGAIPAKLDSKQTATGAVAKSPLGFRKVTTPMLVGAVTIAFYFDAKKAGDETVTLIIDKQEYAYTFKVVAR